LIRVQQQAKEGRDITSEVLNLLRQGLAGAIDPAKIDLNVQGRDSLAARLAAADPDQVAGRSGVTPAEYYARIAEQVIRRRSEMAVFRSPVDANSVPDVSTAVKQWMQSNTVTGPFVLLSAENVGPQVGADLRKKALWAVATSMVGMLLYIAFRFRSFPFGVGAIIATIHDTLITVGLLALFGREFNLVVVAAVLTLVGYSVNDTVVVFDRIRENQRTPKKEPLEAIINRSINQTLSRTVLTSGATMLVVLALFFLGGEVLNTFALTLIIGIIIGTYSSIYVAAPIVVIWKQWSQRRQPVAVVAALKPASAAPSAPSKKKSGRR
jgi:preprotein translocase subunit SecF